MGYIRGRLGTSADLTPHQNLGGPAWDWIVSAAKAAGKQAADYCKENPEDCIGQAKGVYDQLTAKPVEIPNVYGGLNTSVAGGYDVSPAVSAIWVRSSPFSDSKTTEITTLESGQGVNVVGATNYKPKWFYINVPLEGYVYSENLVSSASPGETQQASTLPPSGPDAVATQGSNYADSGMTQGSNYADSGMGALIPIGLAIALLNK